MKLGKQVRIKTRRRQSQGALRPPRRLPSPTSRAHLCLAPQEEYNAAQNAIIKSSRLDECKSWADQASALGAYALQIRDQTLRAMAERIRARAVRRCGELLNPDGELREEALSAGQKRIALEVASIPNTKFEALVESDSPPTVTELAQIARKIRTVH